VAYRQPFLFVSTLYTEFSVFNPIYSCNMWIYRTDQITTEAGNFRP
jgi:hypothetical protein